MSKRRPHEHEQEPEEPQGEYSEHREEPHGTGFGTERAVYEEYLNRKWHGSAPPTPQAYARAIQLWRQLPGSIMTTPSDLGTIPESAPGNDSNEPLHQYEQGKEGTSHES